MVAVLSLPTRFLLPLIFVFASCFDEAWAWGSAPDIPTLNAPVMDEAGLLSPSDREQVTAYLNSVNGQGIQMAIYLPRSLQGYDIESFSIAVAEKWQLGKKGDDKGLLLIVAPNEKRMRFEVGYGLEGELTDAATRRILDNQVAPYFREGRFADGLSAAIGAVGQKLGLKVDPSATQLVRSERKITINPALIFIIIFLLVLFSGGGRRRRTFLGGPSYGGGWGGGGWSGGGGGGGFRGGGGGFGGGGSSSSW